MKTQGTLITRHQQYSFHHDVYDWAQPATVTYIVTLAIAIRDTLVDTTRRGHWLYAVLLALSYTD